MKLASLTIINVAVAFAAISTTYAQTVDAIYDNDSILTMEGARPYYVEAIAVRDRKTAFVGSKSEALKMQGDLAGKTLLPGFIEAHSNYINSLFVANQCQL